QGDLPEVEIRDVDVPGDALALHPDPHLGFARALHLEDRLALLQAFLDRLEDELDLDGRGGPDAHPRGPGGEARRERERLDLHGSPAVVAQPDRARRVLSDEDETEVDLPRLGNDAPARRPHCRLAAGGEEQEADGNEGRAHGYGVSGFQGSTTGCSTGVKVQGPGVAQVTSPTWKNSPTGGIGYTAP